MPPTEAFHRTLNNSNISAEDFSHAQVVRREFDICGLGEYSDLYLKTDVLLLADVLENFRSDCHRAYGLDPAHYYTAPGLTWDAMLKHTGIELQLLTDIDMVFSSNVALEAASVNAAITTPVQISHMSLTTIRLRERRTACITT